MPPEGEEATTTETATTETATATAEATPQTPAAPATGASDADFKEIARKAEERERNAVEALRTANERNREARELARTANETMSRAEQQVAHSEKRMQVALRTLAKLDPESPTSQAITKLAAGVEESAASGSPDLDGKIAKLEQALAENTRVVADVQFQRAVEGLDTFTRGVLHGEGLGEKIKGLIDEKKFVGKVRKACLVDPAIRNSTDAETVERRTREIAKELADEITAISDAGVNRWKGNRSGDNRSAAPTGKEAGAAVPPASEKRVRFTGRNWEEYLAHHGAKE